MIILENSKPGEPLLLHDEPIFFKNKIVGRTTSGNFSFNFNKNLAFGYINSGMSHHEIENSEFEIEIEKKKFKASILKSLHYSLDINDYLFLILLNLYIFLFQYNLYPQGLIIFHLPMLEVHLE